MLRLAGAMDETVLLGIGADNTENLFCASGYFIDSGLARQRRLPQPIRSVVRPPRAADRLDRAVELRRAAVSRRPSQRAPDRWRWSRCSRLPRMWTISGARGTVGIRRGSARMPIYLAAADGLDFQLIKQF